MTDQKKEATKNMSDHEQLEEQIRLKEEEIERDKAENSVALEDNITFGILRPGWTKAIEDGSVDWQDLEGRLEKALTRVKERMYGS